MVYNTEVRWSCQEFPSLCCHQWLSSLALVVLLPFLNFFQQLSIFCSSFFVHLAEIFSSFFLVIFFWNVFMFVLPQLKKIKCKNARVNDYTAWWSNPCDCVSNSIRKFNNNVEFLIHNGSNVIFAVYIHPFTLATPLSSHLKGCTFQKWSFWNEKKSCLDWSWVGPKR